MPAKKRRLRPRFGVLFKVLLVILVCALIPLGLLTVVAIEGGYASVTRTALEGLTRMKERAIPLSKQALDKRARDSNELWAYDTAHRIARFLYEREEDLRALAILPRDPDAYLSFYQAHTAPVWLADGTPQGRFEERPLYREVAFVNRFGREEVRVSDGQVAAESDLRYVRRPELTTYKTETYFSETMALEPGEVYVSRVLGWYVPATEAYAAGEQEGRRFEGIIRLATPVVEEGRKVGIVVLSLDHTHLMEFTAHMSSASPRYRPEVSAISGEHSYIIDSEGWAIAQPRHYYIAGLDEQGQPVPPITAERFAEQAASGYLPANLNEFGFIDEAFPRICEMNRQGVVSGTVEYNWVDQQHPGGRPRALSFATIPYYTGRYNSPAGLGWVAVTADAAKFHEPALLVEAEIEQTAGAMEETVEQARRSLVRNTAWIVAGTVLVVVGAATLFARTLTRPIQDLAQGAAEIGAGNLDARLTLRSRDELGQLATAFNQMAADLRHYTEELARSTAERERLVRELEIAHEIQQSFLPRSWPRVPGIELAAMNLPARHVGGDFYDFIPLQGDRLGLLVADVSDKGVPAALFMALSRSLIRAYSVDSPDVLTALQRANAFIAMDNESMMFVTLFYAVLDPQTLHLTYINAGHNPPLLVGRDSRRLVLLKAKGVALGVVEDLPLEEHQVRLRAGDVLVLYTDGVTEAMNPQREQFGEERLQRIVGENRDLSAEALMRMVNEQIARFSSGAPQSDDITLMVVKVGTDLEKEAHPDGVEHPDR